MSSRGEDWDSTFVICVWTYYCFPSGEWEENNECYCFFSFSQIVIIFYTYFSSPTEKGQLLFFIFLFLMPGCFSVLHLFFLWGVRQKDDSSFFFSFPLFPAVSSSFISSSSGEGEERMECSCFIFSFVTQPVMQGRKLTVLRSVFFLHFPQGLWYAVDMLFGSNWRKIVLAWRVVFFLLLPESLLYSVGRAGKKRSCAIKWCFYFFSQ